MEEKNVMPVPYLVHEGVMARMERTIKRLIVTLVISLVLLFASNAIWLLYMSGYDIETYDYTQDGLGVNIIGSRNGVNYDVSEAGYQSNDAEEEDEEEAGSQKVKK